MTLRGPGEMVDGRGHPRLRMRHVPFAVTVDMRDRWLTHMFASMSRLDLDETSEAQMRSYFVRAATMLFNTEESHGG